MSNDPFHEQVWPLRNRLYRIALRLVGEPETAEDVVQDTLLKLWQQRDRLAGIGSIEGWCVRLVRNTGIDRTRDAYHRRRTDLDRAGDRADPLPDPAGLLEISDERDRLDRLLAALPPDRRLVIQLREIEGFTYQEIADHLQMNLSQVKSELHRGRKSLREAVEQLSEHERERTRRTTAALPRRRDHPGRRTTAARLLRPPTGGCGPAARGRTFRLLHRCRQGPPAHRRRSRGPGTPAQSTTPLPAARPGRCGNHPAAGAGRQRLAKEPPAQVGTFPMAEIRREHRGLVALRDYRPRRNPPRAGQKPRTVSQEMATGKEKAAPLRQLKLLSDPLDTAGLPQ